jgi:hypothetical protein
MNRGGRTDFLAALADVRHQLARATTRRDDLTAQLARTPVGAEHDLVQTRLTAAQTTVDQLAAASASMTLEQVGQDQVVAIDPDRPQLAPAPSTLVPRAVLAVLLGLLVGAAAAVFAETMRPRMAGIRAVARVLDAPVLGSARDRTAALVNTLTLAARRQGLETVVLLGVDPSDDLTAMRMLREFRAKEAAVEVPATLSVGAHSSDRDDVAVGGPGIPMGIRFTSLAEVGAADERTAGVVVVSSGSPRQRDIDRVDDILRAMRWPVVGVLDSTSRRRHRGGQS